MVFWVRVGLQNNGLDFLEFRSQTREIMTKIAERSWAGSVRYV